jgi:hypothetical protein
MRGGSLRLFDPNLKLASMGKFAFLQSAFGERCAIESRCFAASFCLAIMSLHNGVHHIIAGVAILLLHHRLMSLLESEGNALLSSAVFNQQASQRNIAGPRQATPSSTSPTDFRSSRPGEFIRLEAICQAVWRKCPEPENTSFRRDLPSWLASISQMSPPAAKLSSSDLFASAGPMTCVLSRASRSSASRYR